GRSRRRATTCHVDDLVFYRQGRISEQFERHRRGLSSDVWPALPGDGRHAGDGADRGSRQGGNPGDRRGSGVMPGETMNFSDRVTGRLEGHVLAVTIDNPPVNAASAS